MLVRCHGGISFGSLRDRSGTVQLVLDRSVVDAEVYQNFRELRRGDWIGVTGLIMATDKGELSIAVTTLTRLGSASRAPSDKNKTLTDVETRYRRRYVDLMTNQRTRDIFEIRRRVIQAIRRHLEDHGFWEVEGPILQSIQGGATARPFISHHNALDIDLYLRIALELHLKRLVVGGMERVFEIGRVFRNEGIDLRHNPEFTMLEAYQAFADYTDMMNLVEGLLTAAVTAAREGDFVIKLGDRTVDLSPPWPRITMSDLLEQRLGVRMDPLMSIEAARAILHRFSVEWRPEWGAGKMMKQLLDELVQPEILEPIFCIDYPQEVSPLARAHRSRPGYVERFELMVAGFELCNAYSEQNDSVAQLAAFTAEARAKAQGDPEAGDIDLDYLRALEYGLPCTGGLGIGIDRLVMLLAGATNIREVILFPTMRPEADQPSPVRVPILGLGRIDQPLGRLVAKVTEANPSAAARVGSGLGPISAGPTAAAARPVAVSEDIPASALEEIHRRLAGRASRASQPASRRRLRLLGALAGLGGVIMLLTLVPVLHSRLGTPIGPVWFRVTGHLLTMLIGLGLLFLAGQVSRGKRRAWQVSLALFAVGVITNVLKGPHPISSAYCAGMVVTLIGNQRLFQGRADPPSLFRIIRLAPVYAASVLTFGFINLGVERHQLGQPLTLLGGLQTIAQGLIGIGSPYTYHQLFFREFFPRAMLTQGVAGFIGVAYLLFRPLRTRAPHTENDWERARRIVHEYGSDTLAYFALRDDKSFFFSSDGEALIAYTYLGGYALASGDPIGAPGSLDLALDEFMFFCQQRSWRLAFLAARRSEMPRYAARGLRSFYLGDEAIVQCDSFTLQGSAMKGIRAAVRRVAHTYQFQIIREAQASPALVDQLNAISQKWRGKAPERGFTMSLSQDVEGNGRNAEFLLCVALDASGAPGGFLRIVPAYGPDFGYTLDLMRHLPDAPNGMTEYLIAQTALALGAEGIVRLSMNFAMWGRLYDQEVVYTVPQRLAKRAVDVLNPFFQIKTLYDFNAKFAPQWLARVLVFQEPTDLPRVGLLYAGAEGFLSLPGIGELFVPKAVGGVGFDDNDGVAQPDLRAQEPQAHESRTR